jgi:Immunity protein 26
LSFRAAAVTETFRDTNSMPTKRQQWTRGAIVCIPLGDGFHSYAQMIEAPEFAFFDIQSAGDIRLSEVVSRAVIFRLWVMRTAHSQGRWLKIGKTELSAALLSPDLRYNQDSFPPHPIRLTYDGCNGPPATVSDCESDEDKSDEDTHRNAGGFLVFGANTRP